MQCAFRVWGLVLFLFNFFGANRPAYGEGTATHLTTVIAASSIGVINGDPDPDDEESKKNGRFATGLLYITGGEKKGKGGSGIALCSNVVLTAGHVADQTQNGLSFVMRETARENLETGKKKGVAVVDKFSLRESGDRGTHYGSDLALVKLDRPVNVGFKFAFGKVASENKLNLNSKLRVVGYGLSDESKKWTDKGEGGIRRGGDVVPSEYLSSADKRFVALKVVPGEKKQLGAPGDSGAPVFLKNRDGSLGEVVGLHVAGTGSLEGVKDEDKRGHVALVYPHFKRLQSKLKEWCPPEDLQ